MKRNRLKKLGDFVLGKGFYIVLFLCVAAIGISGYYLIRTVTVGSQPSQPAAASQTVTLPDASSPAPQTQEEEPEEPAPVQPDDPQPLKEPVQQEEAAAPAQPKEVVYTWPVKGEVLRGFSLETLAYDVTMGDWRTHSGLDIAAPAGTEVRAAASGIVTEVTQDVMLGTTVVIDHGGAVSTTCANLAAVPTVEVGDSVTAGDVIGSVGATAIAESALPSHLHFSVARDGVSIDPMELLN